MVEFDDIEGIFGSIWAGNYEDYFYQKAWEILTKAGLTEYDDDAGYVRVVLRAAALYMFFAEFSQAAFDETIYVSQIAETVENSDDCVDNFWFLFGQIYGKFSNEKEICEDVREAIFELVEAEKDGVFEALENGFFQYELACVLYSVVEIDSVLREDEEGFGEYISDYDDFWKMVDKHWLDFSANPDENLIRGYSWLSDGAPTIAFYDLDTI